MHPVTPGHASRAICSYGRVGSLVLATLILLGSSPGLQAGKPQRPEPVTRPHIILFIADHSLALNDSSAALPTETMPHLSGLIRRGIWFTECFAAATDPELADLGIHYGQFPRWVSEDEPDGPGAEQPTPKSMANHIRSLGYRLLLIGQQPTGADREFPFEVIGRPGQLAPGQADADAALDPLNLREWLARETRTDHRPLCLVVRDRIAPDATEAQQAATTDRRLGRVMDAFAAQLPAEETLIMFTAVRGRPESETNESMSDAALRIPLVLVQQGRIPAGARSQAMISSVDFVPTLVELAGGTPPSDVDGLSFAAIVRGESYEHRDLVFAVHREVAALPADSETSPAEALETSPERAIQQSRLEQSGDELAPGDEGAGTLPPGTEPTTVRPTARWSALVRDRRFKFILAARPGRIFRWSERESSSSDQLNPPPHLEPVVEERFVDSWSDPQETENQIHQPAHQGAIIEMRYQLRSWLQHHGLKRFRGGR